MKEVIKIEEINFIINSIPQILQYFIPGYWSIFLFKYMTSKEIPDYIMNIMSCVISYMLLAIVAFLKINVLPETLFPNTVLIDSGLSFLIGTIFSLLFALIFSSKWFSQLMVKTFHKTPNNDIWRDVLDLNNGSNLKVYIKDAEYYVIGHHKAHEEKGDEGWLTISAFEKIDKETNKNYKEEPSFLNDESVIYAVRFSDIEHIEVFN